MLPLYSIPYTDDRMDEQKLLENAKSILQKNDRGNWIMPSADIYPHQWLWDSCFISIGLRHLEPERAKLEIESLFRGQWNNGMMPNIIFASGKEHRRVHNLWRSYLSPYAPDGVITSGVTQPPMIAEAVVQVGQLLKSTERRSWYSSIYPSLLKYHEWMYRERDPGGEGLVTLIHPYESGLDNSPPWISELRKHSMPFWIKAIEKLHLDWVVSFIRTDTRHVPPRQRMNNADAMGYWWALRSLRRKSYDSKTILSKSLFAVEDLAFNSILFRANSHLKNIASGIGEKIPRFLLANMEKTGDALEQLWDDEGGQYYSRNFVTHKLIKEPSIATLLPLYGGSVSKERAERLVSLIKKRKYFGSNSPIPSVPINSTSFDPYRSWQGPTWINTNWLLIDGLKRYGFDEEAEQLKYKTMQLVSKSSMYEYFNPLTGEPAGAPDFSWTAALTIDLLKN